MNEVNVTVLDESVKLIVLRFKGVILMRDSTNNISNIPTPIGPNNAISQLYNELQFELLQF